MNHAEYVDAVRRESALFSTAARAAGIDAAVPSCPDWVVADLVTHIGQVQRWVSGLLATGTAEPSAPRQSIESPTGAAMFGWFEEGAAALAAALGAAEPTQPVWSWTSDTTAGFWSRRQANEVAVHRVDAQLAAGTPTAIDRELAVDGIDEFFDLIPYWRGAAEVVGAGESLHFHCTDSDGEWLAKLQPDGVVITREHAKGDVAARGSASDLLLFLYGRVAADDLEVFGDATLLARWRESLSW